MNLSNSKQNNNNNNSSTGSESGWTMYLQQSSIFSSYDQYPITNNGNQDPYRWSYDHTTEDQLDLSMVSDASSGPNPHNEEEEEGELDCCSFNPCTEKSVRKPKKKEIKRMKMKDKIFYQSLDDTASSHSSQRQEAIHSSEASADQHSMESNGSRQFKGKSTSVKKSYSRSSIK